MRRPWIFMVVGLLAVAWLLLRQWQGARIEHDFDPLIRDAAASNSIDPSLVKAVIWRESGFDPQATGSKGEIGLMQLRELAAIEWAGANGILGFELEHLSDPRTNVLAGTWYLARLIRRYSEADQPLVYALADYNAGRKNVLQWNKGEAATNATVFLEQMEFPSTRRYIELVLKRRERYRRDF
jgi:soluble lytic murein transglycosylase